MAYTEKTVVVLVGALACAACGGDELVVRGVLGKDEQCGYVPEERYASARKTYDVRAANTEESLRCEGSFYAQLLVRSAGSDGAVVQRSEVRLMDIDGRTIAFDRYVTELPNPFQVTVGFPVRGGASTVVPVEAIPSAYGEQLDGFVGTQLRIELRLEGSADGDEVVSEPFAFPVDVCDGCLSFCASDPNAPATGACDETVRSGEICIDEDC